MKYKTNFAMQRKIKIITYLSIIFAFFCLQFDYLVTMAMEKYYGEIFYTQLEENILVQLTGNINVILIGCSTLLLLYVIYQIICYKILKRNKSYIVIDCGFISEFILFGICHLAGGLSWFFYGWY